MVDIMGWGWIGTASSTYASPGFISFNCHNLNVICANDYHVSVDTDTKTVNGWAWAGTKDATTSDVLGWIQFSGNANDYLSAGETLPAYVTSGAVYSESGEISGWARIYSLGKYGWNEKTPKSNEWGWIKLRGSNYGVSLDRDFYKDTPPWESYGKLVGWGFSAPSGGKGFGLVQFDASVIGVDGWIQTKYGDVYSGADIDIPAPTGQVNASFLILSTGTVSNFDTNLSGGTMTGYDIPFPELNSGSYRSNIGKINITSLESSATEFFTDTELDNRVLDGDSYIYNGNLIIDDPITIPNGSGSIGVANTLGNGTIIIDGDLTVNRNISYGDSSVENLYNLASAAWIITGNLTIGSNVTEMAGAYIVLGETGVSTGEGNQPLNVYGLMMAKAFNFQRDRVKEETKDVPSEKFIYDGHALLNTPPGLEDLIATLPELNISTP